MVLIVSGPSGSGKSTLVQRILQMPGMMASAAGGRIRTKRLRGAWQKRERRLKRSASITIIAW